MYSTSGADDSSPSNAAGQEIHVIAFFMFTIDYGTNFKYLFSLCSSLVGKRRWQIVNRYTKIKVHLWCLNYSGEVARGSWVSEIYLNLPI